LSSHDLSPCTPPPPPRPPLLPYTTLFRSGQRLGEAVHRRRLRGIGASHRHRPLPRVSRLGPARGTRDGGDRRGSPLLAERCCPADRKSTRLNSSHVKISYAVFCLKKKTEA